MFSIIGSICVGDKTSCGKTIMTGTPFTRVNGREIARIGDKISCKHNCVIVSGNQTEIIDGSPMAIHGSLTAKNCTCISSNNNYHGDGQTPADIAAVPVAADAGIAYMPETAAILNEEHWVDLRLINDESHPLAGQRFILVDPAGNTHEGLLDETGYARVSPVKAGLCKVEFPDIGYTMTVDS